VARTPRTRRAFLVGSAATLGAAALAACGSSSSKPSSSTSGTSATGSKPGTSGASVDLHVAALATSLENLAVATYQAGIDAATAGKLGTVPPAVVTFATTAQQQHRDHAAAWNAILTGAGKPAVTGVDTTVKRLYAFEWGARVLMRGGFGRAGQVMPPVWRSTRSR
jgi:hypothetical protein